MSHLNRQSSEREEHPKHGAAQPTGETAPTLFPNVLTGVVFSRTEGLSRTTYRIRIGERTNLRMRWPLAAPSSRTLRIGQTVRLTIPQEAIHLEAGGFRRGKQRWNRWIGRVVLAAHNGESPSITVKIHQAPITLKSCGPVIGAHAPLATWDTVNIVIDPQRIKVCSCALASRKEPPPQHTTAPATYTTAAVWLRTVVRAVRPAPIGYHLTLNAGGTTLSVLIEARVDSAAAWKAGDSLEVNIGRGDAWIRHSSDGLMVPCSVVLSSEIGTRPRSAAH